MTMPASQRIHPEPRGASRRRLLLATACLALALAGAPPAAGQDAHPGVQRSRWWDGVKRCENALGRSRWRRALKCVDALRDKVSEKSWYEPDLGEVLATLELQRAVAEANLGRDDDALWDWWEALNLHPDVASTDLAPYGKASELLRSHPLRGRGEYPEGYQAPEIIPGASDYQPPVEDLEPTPKVHPNGAALHKNLPPVQLEVFFDARGVPRQPVVTSDWSHPITIYWALETLRFSPPARPAHLDGKPVATLEQVEFDWGGDVVR